MAVSEEERQRALEQGIPLKNGVPVREPVTSEAFEPTEEIDLEQPETTPVADITAIPEPRLTGEQKRKQELGEETIEEQEKLKGEAEFRAKQEERFGITEKEKRMQDLSQQLRAFQAEAKAIPMQVQQESEGLGRTKGATQVITTARLRKNAIKALTISATLEATRGNLAFALDQVDRAVSQKYDPIKEEIRVNKANLDIISDSPLATLEEKKEAARVKRQENKREKEIDEQETNERAIYNILLEAIPKGIDLISQRKIEELLENPTRENVVEAQRIASEAMPAEMDLTGASQELRTFAVLNPQLEVGTEEFKRRFEAFQEGRGDGRGDDIFSSADKRTIKQAGLTETDVRTKNVFVNTPSDFQRFFVRQGLGSPDITPDKLLNELEKWETGNIGGLIDDQLLQLIELGATDAQIVEWEDEGLSFEEMLERAGNEKDGGFVAGVKEFFGF